MNMSNTQEIVEELRAGRMVILVDEEDRENLIFFKQRLSGTYPYHMRRFDSHRRNSIRKQNRISSTGCSMDL